MLVSGDLACLGDTLMQRLKAIQQAVEDGHWGVAKQLEVTEEEGVSLVSPMEQKEAVRGAQWHRRIKESLKSKPHP